MQNMLDQTLHPVLNQPSILAMDKAYPVSGGMADSQANPLIMAEEIKHSQRPFIVLVFGWGYSYRGH